MKKKREKETYDGSAKCYERAQTTGDEIARLDKQANRPAFSEPSPRSLWERVWVRVHRSMRWRGRPAFG